MAQVAVFFGLVVQKVAEFIVAFVMGLFDFKARGEEFELIARERGDLIELFRTRPACADGQHFRVRDIERNAEFLQRGLLRGGFCVFNAADVALAGGIAKDVEREGLLGDFGLAAFGLDQCAKRDEVQQLSTTPNNNAHLGRHIFSATKMRARTDIFQLF